MGNGNARVRRYDSKFDLKVFKITSKVVLSVFQKE